MTPLDLSEQAIRARFRAHTPGARIDSYAGSLAANLACWLRSISQRRHLY
jgi:hypothetical protein